MHEKYFLCRVTRIRLWIVCASLCIQPLLYRYLHQAPRSVEKSGESKNVGGGAKIVYKEALLVVYYLMFDILCKNCSAVPEN